MEAVDDYRQSLNDLTLNSKPLINMLTILADENKTHSDRIVKVIEARLGEARPSEKLPVLYLIDSIMKNISGGNYKENFSENLVLNFIDVFKTVDEKTRQSMYKLRQTWNNVFPNKKLYVLDVRVNQIDPAWPISSQAPSMSSEPIAAKKATVVPVQRTQQAEPSTVHFNPNFNRARGEASSSTIGAKQRELESLKEMEIELNLQKQRAIVQKQKEELDTLERARGAKIATSLTEFLQQIPQLNEQLGVFLTQGNASGTEKKKRKLADAVGPEEVIPVSDLLPGLAEKKTDMSRRSPSPRRLRGVLRKKTPEKSREEDERAQVRPDSPPPHKKSALASPSGKPAAHVISPSHPVSETPASTEHFANTPRVTELPGVSGTGPLSTQSIMEILPTLGPQWQDKLVHLLTEQLQSGQLTSPQHGELMKQLRAFFTVQEKISTLETSEAAASGDIDERAEAEVVVVEPPPPAPIPITATAGVPVVPPFLEKSQLHPGMFPPHTSQLVLNGMAIEMSVNGPPRQVMIGTRVHVVRIKAINQRIRQVLVDNTPHYTLSAAICETSICGHRVLIFFHGRMQTVWLDNTEYRLRVDAPPQTIILASGSMDMILNSTADEIVASGEIIGKMSKLPMDVMFGNTRYRMSFSAPAKRIRIDNEMCEIKLNLPVPAVLQLKSGQLRGIRFDGPPRIIVVSGKSYEIFCDRPVSIRFGPKEYFTQLGAPAQELIVGNKRYEVQFGQPPCLISVDGYEHMVELPGHTPEVKIQGPIDLTTGQVLDEPEAVIAPRLEGFPVHGDQVFPSHAPPSMGQVRPAARPTPAASQWQQCLPDQEGTGPNQPVEEISNLFAKLQEHGLLVKPPQGASNTDRSSAPATLTGRPAPITRDRAPPNLFQQQAQLRTRYTGEIEELYMGQQCATCGQRFREDRTYKLHLDYHFRQNSLPQNKMVYRQWYLKLFDWVEYEFVLEQLEDQLDDSRRPVTPEPPELVTCAATDKEERCHVCHEKFEQFWKQEEEEWHLKGAIRVGSRAHHVICHPDATPTATPQLESKNFIP